MFELMSLKSELMLICSTLTKALLVEILTAVEKVSKKPETKEKISSFITSLCLEAVDKIFKILEDAAVSPVLKDPPELGRLFKGGATEEYSTEQTVIRVYNKNAALDSKCILLALQDPAANFTGENNAISETRTLVDLPDHDYARCSSQPLSTSTSEGGGVSQFAKTHLACSQCRRLFPNTERLADHHRKSHPVCSVCRAVFTGVLKLREHEIKEHGVLPYACDHCTKRFNHKAHRDLHVKVRHTGERSCHCDICGKGYASASMLKTHQMTHSDKTFICDVCGKSFYHFCHLTRHKLVHQDVRPYRCDTCGQGFTQADNLRSHQAVHSGERQLCFICGKKYRFLKNHIIRKHGQGLPAHELPDADSIVTCQDCGKKFPNQSHLRVHQRSHVGETPYPCDISWKNYHSKDLLHDHNYTHTSK